MTTGSLRGAGSNGYYWAIPTYPSELSAYYLYFTSANVYPSNDNDRWRGFTVQTPISGFMILVLSKDEP